MIQKIAFICLLVSYVPVQAYHIVIAGENACDDPRYLQEGRKSHRVMNTVLEAWYQITEQLEQHGITTTVIARNSLHLHPSADLYIFWDMPSFSDFHLASAAAQKSFVILCEPITIFCQYNPGILNQFKRVFTWDDQFAQTFHYIKYTLPVLKSYKGSSVPFAQKKFACMLCGNKRSWNDREMYSERRNILEFFTTHYPTLFDLYGPDWEYDIKTYKGMVPDKRYCLEQYLFNFCLENTRNTTGYITEKIFDAMEAGTIPIYKGASNIDEYIPRNCYIAYDDFASLEELKTYMCSITEQEYEQYQHNIRAYLASPQAQEFAIPSFVQLFVTEILHFFDKR